MKVQCVSNIESNRTSDIPDHAVSFTLRNLTAGATYSLLLFTVLDTKESVAYTSRNFTTSKLANDKTTTAPIHSLHSKILFSQEPNTPGKFIVWFRNETTLLVLWQPPYPAGIYGLYRVSIDPNDAQEPILYVEKEGEPPGPAQAAFKGLTPGKYHFYSIR